MAAGGLTTTKGLVATTRLRSGYDAMRTYDRSHAVAVLDSALHLGKLTAEQVDSLFLRLRGDRLACLALTDGAAEADGR